MLTTMIRQEAPSKYVVAGHEVEIYVVAGPNCHTDNSAYDDNEDHNEYGDIGFLDHVVYQILRCLTI